MATGICTPLICHAKGREEKLPPQRGPFGFGFLVRRQHIDIWATTIANEPDGGDGNQIPPAGLAYTAHRLAPRVMADGVRLDGPDTANATHALHQDGRGVFSLPPRSITTLFPASAGPQADESA